MESQRDQQVVCQPLENQGPLLAATPMLQEVNRWNWFKLISPYFLFTEMCAKKPAEKNVTHNVVVGSCHCHEYWSSQSRARQRQRGQTYNQIVANDGKLFFHLTRANYGKSWQIRDKRWLIRDKWWQIKLPNSCRLLCSWHGSFSHGSKPLYENYNLRIYRVYRCIMMYILVFDVPFGDTTYGFVWKWGTPNSNRLKPHVPSSNDRLWLYPSMK